MLQPVEDILALFFPEYCSGCHSALSGAEKAICTDCRNHLPKAGFHNDPNNLVEKLFWGRVPLIMATGFLRFAKEGIVQKLLHDLKYRHALEVGEVLGRLFAAELVSTPRFGGVDVIIPVPLHPHKQKQRGYNQCDPIVYGMSEVLHIPCSHALGRVVANSSQTRKGRFERWINVDSIFSVSGANELQGKHVLLVDDVITTGSTIASCAEALLKVDGLKLSVGTLAFPMN
jgi:ComF family protein